MGLYDFTIYDLISRNVVCFGDRLAWFEVDDNRTLTFAEFKKSVDRLACGLQEASVQKMDRIAVLGKNSLEYFLLYGAAAATGAIVLPINWRLSADEVCFNLNDCEPTVIFVDKEYQELIKKTKKDLPSIQKYYNLKPDGGAFLDFKSLMNNKGDFKQIDISSDDGFVIIHTAAVDGKPRGALLSHNNLLCSNLHLNYTLNLTHKDVHLNLLPLFHVGGLFMAISSFHAGALNINMSKFDAEKAVEIIDDKKATVLFDFAPILSSILEQHEKTGRNIKSLKKILGIDTPETIEKYQKTTGGIFYCLYGQTETSFLATLGPYNNKPGSAGKMLHLAGVRIMDNYDNPLPTGQTGEITLKGPAVFKGYWNLPRVNEHVFREGYHHTGDMGRFDEDGFLWYMGRTPDKELIKPGGENVYPYEVEKVILQHPDVENVVVFGVPDPKWKEGIKAVCVLKKGKTLDRQDLISFVGKRIASYKKPQYVEFVSDLPVLEDGSLDRAKIKKLYGGLRE
ncbi:MAG: AMP-binding protein [Desulfobacterales bacterium]|nr:AMP-binding protein [Desulfobacterales bacterium]